MTDFILTPADNNAVLAGAPVNGTITKLEMIQSPDYTGWSYGPYGQYNKNTPDFWITLGGDAEIGVWARINVNLLDGAIFPLTGPNISIPYKGNLFVWSVPVGSQFALSTL
jgi:hypothetical protein